VGEWEKGRKGEWEKGRVGERESGSVGDDEIVRHGEGVTRRIAAVSLED
jgi:hypothetical protein